MNYLNSRIIFSSESNTKRKQESLLEKFINKSKISANKSDRIEEPSKATHDEQEQIEASKKIGELIRVDDSSNDEGSSDKINESSNEVNESCDMISEENIEESTENLTANSNSENESEEEKLTDAEHDSSVAEEKSMLCEEEKTDLNTSSSTTPMKSLSSKQLQRKLEFEKKRMEKQKEREEKEMERQRLKEERGKLKQEKEEQKQKERLEKQKEKELKEEQKRKEREEKEQKKKEKDEKEEQKRKEKEQEKLKRQMEIDEKNKEKLKAEEQKQKAAAAFVNFFVAKKTTKDDKKQELNSSTFMPFEVKSDMRLAPLNRRDFNQEDKENLINELETQDSTKSYLRDLNSGKGLGRSENTWPVEDNDIVIVDIEEDLGESITEQKPEPHKIRAKYLYFRENQRPPYFGTWRKRSKFITPRKPFALDEQLNYENDSDDEWEEEDPGESLRGSDDEDKENDSANEYEVDNDIFVPHGHLSEDELDDEENVAFSPESHKVKLKLLKNEFDEEMKLKRQKIKPRLIGCIWYDKNHTIKDEAIDKYLKPFAILHNNGIVIKKRLEISMELKNRNKDVSLDKEHVREFVKIIDGNNKKRKVIVEEFLKTMQDREVAVKKKYLNKLFKTMAKWCKIEGNSSKKITFSWLISDEYKKEYSI